MHESLKNIQEKLEELNGALRSALPNDQPFGIGQGNWSFPNLSRSELVADIQSIIDLIEAEGGDDVGEQEALLSDYTSRLEQIRVDHGHRAVAGLTKDRINSFILDPVANRPGGRARHAEEASHPDQVRDWQGLVEA